MSIVVALDSSQQGQKTHKKKWIKENVPLIIAFNGDDFLTPTLFTEEVAIMFACSDFQEGSKSSFVLTIT